MKDNNMKKNDDSLDDTLKEEYNLDELFSKGNPATGKYSTHFKQVVVFLDQDLVKDYPNSESVNKALRSLKS